MSDDLQPGARVPDPAPRAVISNEEKADQTAETPATADAKNSPLKSKTFTDKKES